MTSEVTVFPYLEELSLTRCPVLRNAPSRFPSLRELWISECQGLSSIGVPTSLQVLEIHYCGSLTSIPISKGLPSLRELRIRYCDGLSGLPDLHYCPSLQYLSVGYCGKLKSLTTGLRFLDCLEKLKLGPFWEELDTFPDFQVPSQQLVSLELNGWPKLKSVPQPIIHFTSVEELTIRDFNGVEDLPEWLGNLTSVRKLHVLDCENVKYLPSLKAMRGLTKLETLRIARCPLLEEWPKISHVPNIDCKLQTDCLVMMVTLYEDWEKLNLVRIANGSDPRRSTPS
ncbi:putative disease resistance protein RGA3 [Argentina anserina]|uniref:putative disease resistance protein RGA3 n=1 Tax=Argentina anserina TaxID=57926 RepID=UPI0021762E27|nr:putative disease resistance protein RGA3 [Potentilla anserina]